MSIRIAIVGAGPGGYVAAVRAAQLGADVTVVEADNVGGTCLNWGCIPSKVMKATAELIDRIGRAAEFGISVSANIQTDMRALAARKRAVIRNQTEGILHLLRHHKVRYLQGRARIGTLRSLTVQMREGAPIEVPWDKLVLAPGTRPAALPGLAFDGERIISSNEALLLEEVPQSLLIVGGGVVGCEFGCIFAAIGSRVTIVEALERLLPLPSVDTGCSKALQREMKKRKITVLTSHTVTGVERGEKGVCVRIRPQPQSGAATGSGLQETLLDVEKVLVCIGRRPLTEGIGLETAMVTTDDRGWVLADDRMQTRAPDIYAIGDVLGPAKVMLAHVASAEGRTAAENAMGLNRRMDYGVIPAAVFTMPEVAAVGWTEEQAVKMGCDFRADRVFFRAVGKAQALGEIAGEMKLISERQTARLLGVHIIGPQAADLIAEATLALQLKASVHDLAETIHAHPTLSEIMMEASFKALGRPLHG